MEFPRPTLDCVLDVISRRYSNKPAVILGNTRLSYADLNRLSCQLADNLSRLGLGKGDKVAIILPNCVEYLYLYFALFRIGAWAVPMSTRWEPDELKNVLVDADISAIIYDTRIGVFNYVEILERLRPSLPLCKHFIRRGESSGPDHLSLARLIEQPGSPPAAKEEILGEDVALLAYTSGTTGRPKGVMIPHRNLVLTSWHTRELWGLGDEIAFSVAPLYAAQGFLAVLIDLVAGITMRWNTAFNPNEILAELAQGDITAFHTQPTMWTMLLNQPALDFIDVSHLKKVVVSGSLCSRELARAIEAKMGCTVYNAYGLIEATGVVATTRPGDSDEIRHGSVGRPIPGVEVRIVGEDRKDVTPGEIGELAVRGYLMHGYYKNEATTREVIDEDGWLYTGDLACFTADGENIRIVGRCKDMVIRGGFNVYPIDIEERILQHDGVEDCAVVGKPDDLLGESLVAFVIPKPGVRVTGGDIKRFCRGHIANYKIPDDVVLVSQFPILLSGKVLKNILRQWAADGVPDECRLLFDNTGLCDTP